MAQFRQFSRVQHLESVFPLIKLGSLVFRQISKPFAKWLQRRAKDNKFFREYFCMKPAQTYHWLDTTLRMRILGLGSAKDVKPLSEEMATELGAEMLGEIIIFSAAVATLYFEYWRQSKNSQAHEDEQNSKLDDLEQKVSDMGLMLEEQDAKIRELTRATLDNSSSNKSLAEKLVGAVIGSKSAPSNTSKAA
ncbi:optic atrophy 3 protein homolog [Lineus longissimus]|uniref:optic atrophy 3 protein homolog n=1 Tax=Lineus longissimus TaxID=88925 RepID=UPI002B4E4C5A